MKFAYLSRGRLFLQSQTEEIQVESEFGAEMEKRAVRRQQQNEWRGQNEDSAFGQLWGGRGAGENTNFNLRIASVARGAEADNLLFVLNTNNVGGLFLYDMTEKVERRLVHKQEFFIRDLDRHLESDELVCTRWNANGTANLGLMRGYNVVLVTEGDSIDEAPSWVFGREKEIVFHSAGVARNNAGVPVGISPFAIQRLHLDGGEMQTVVSNSAYDHLLPHMDASGNLFFIRRPYEPLGQRRNGLESLKDILLFPFRVLRTLFDWLNFMSMVYSRKPLTTAGGPEKEMDDIKKIVLRGRVVDAEKALRENKGRRKSDTPSLVPASWELVRRTPSGAEMVLAKHVVAFDMDANGRLIYTNGTTIFQHHGEKQKPTILAKGRLVDTVCLLD